MIEWLLEPLQHPFNQRAILAALMIGFTNGYASAFVVLKKSALKVGSLSHALLPGIAVAILVAGLHDWSAFLGSLFAALLIGLGSLAVSRGSRLDQDSALAILYTAAFSGGIILLRRIGVTQEMEEWLFGNIMGLRDGDLWTNFWISFGALGVLTALHRPLLMTLFDAEVAATLGVPVRALNYLLMAVLIIVLISSLQAVGCMLAIRASGLRVPEDISVIGFDDVQLSRYVGLTTVRQHLEQSGYLGMQTLLDLLSTPENVKPRHLPPLELVVRQTTQRLKAT